tara:strand:- start:59 stop:802 length:744 start_codon:yes stop_codon:yes gene_type:complete
MSQLITYALARNELIPVLIKISDLQKYLSSQNQGMEEFQSAWNWADAYLRIKYGVYSEQYLMLRQALMARRVLLLLDGIDEGGKARDRIETHIREVLAPQGFVMLVTSRPNGISKELFEPKCGLQWEIADDYDGRETNDDDDDALKILVGLLRIRSELTRSQLNDQDIDVRARSHAHVHLHVHGHAHAHAHAHVHMSICTCCMCMHCTCTRSAYGHAETVRRVGRALACYGVLAPHPCDLCPLTPDP